VHGHGHHGQSTSCDNTIVKKHKNKGVTLFGQNEPTKKNALHLLLAA
jgi:hypothetical protein